MSVEQRFIAKLKELQVKYATEILTKPTDPTAFGYGRASGELIGLKRAERLFEEAIGEEDDGT
jgi:hypothetical protein